MIWLTACGEAPVPLSPVDGSARVQVVVGADEQTVLSRTFVVSATAPVEGELVCVSPADPLEDHHLPFAGTAGVLRLDGLLADTPYDCELGSSWSGSFRTDPLPEGMPVLRVSGDRELASSDEGYVLFGHWKLGEAYPEVQRQILVDGDGRVRWYLGFPDARTGGVAGQWGDGWVVAGGGQGLSPGVWTRAGAPLFQVPEAVQADPGYHHEAFLTADGWLVTLQGVDNSGGGLSFIGFRVEATDPATGVVEWSFDSQPWVDAGVLPLPEGDDLDPYHANAVSWVDDDPEGPAVWVSLRGLQRLMRIDRITGEVTGFLGSGAGGKLLGRDGEVLPDPAWFWGQHAPEFRGEDLWVYDNGASRPGTQQVSRVMWLRRLDPENTQLLWEWSEPGWYEPNFGSVNALPDGHVLVGTGHCADCGDPGDVAWIAEIDPTTNAVVWRFDFTRDDDTLYRAAPVDGCSLPNRRYCRSSDGGP